MNGIADLGFASVDTDREQRQGLPETVYAPGKERHEIVAIVTRLLASSRGPVLVTRIEEGDAEAVLAAVAEYSPAPGHESGTVHGSGSRGVSAHGHASDSQSGTYHARARLLSWRAAPTHDTRVRVVSAGTADGPVAEEALRVARAIGLDAELITDIGVAGIHRLIARAPELQTSDIVIVVAGMEGALASAVGGLVGCPVVAVPTSTGYGAALEGVTALLAMLTSCAAGMTVVNIDSGFGAAMAAHRLAHTMRNGHTAHGGCPPESPSHPLAGSHSNTGSARARTSAAINGHTTETG